MSQETQDTVFGIMVLIPFLVLVFLLGYAINKLKNRRFTRAWAPLVPVIGGTIVEDGGGAASSWLTGTWRGRTVRAGLCPDRNRYQGESGARYNSFEIAVLNLPGAADWRLEWKSPILGFGPEGWQIDSADAAVAERLRAAGAVALVERLGTPTVVYSRSARTLQFEEDAGPVWTPAPERFREELDILLQLAEIQERVNPPRIS
jgi:hypothetical protein